MEIDRTNKQSDWIKSGRTGRGWGTKEGVGNVSRDENAFDAQINPCSGKIGKRHAPVFLAFVDVRLVRKTVDAIPLTEIPFMVLTLVLVRDARVELEKWREEKVRRIAGRGSDRRR